MITVVTPTIRGRAPMLYQAMRSVARQTLLPHNHLVETDVHHEGPGPTLNKLIDRVETEWYAVLNDDDLFDPDHLETLYFAVGDADIAISWPHEDGLLNGEPPYRGTFDPWKFVAKEDQGMRPGCYLARKKVWDKVRYRDMPIEDWDFMARAIFRRFRVQPVYRETWTYRHHPGQSSRIYEAALNGGELPENTYHLGKWLPASASSSRR